MPHPIKVEIAESRREPVMSTVDGSREYAGHLMAVRSDTPRRPLFLPPTPTNLNGRGRHSANMGQYKNRAWRYVPNGSEQADWVSYTAWRRFDSCRGHPEFKPLCTHQVGGKTVRCPQFARNAVEFSEFVA